MRTAAGRELEVYPTRDRR